MFLGHKILLTLDPAHRLRIGIGHLFAPVSSFFAVFLTL